MLADDSEAALAARVLAQEHASIRARSRWLVEGALERRDGVVAPSRGESQLLCRPRRAR